MISLSLWQHNLKALMARAEYCQTMAMATREDPKTCRAWLASADAADSNTLQLMQKIDAEIGKAPHDKIQP